jgi:flagellar basal body rod protein FlgG
MTIYVNGETVTQNTSSLGTNKINQASVVHQIGEIVATGNPLNALMSHINFCDGTALAPTVFGSVDSTTGEWKINTSPSFTLGNNGFTILKDGNTITDQSTNSNAFSLSSGTLTKSEDNPSNVFSTWNVLDRYYTQAIFSNGNATVKTPNASETYCTSTLGMSSGKYYMEVEIYDGSNRDNIGIVDSVATDNSNNLYQKSKGYSYRGVGGVWNNDSQLSGTFSAYGGASGHKVMIAVDLDNSKLYFGFNGTWQNSGDPTSGSTGTGAISITPTSDLSNGCYFFCSRR